MRRQCASLQKPFHLCDTFFEVSTQVAQSAVASAAVREDLVGLAGIPDLLGVTLRTAQKYVDRADFPEPYARIGNRRIWRRDDIAAWASRTLPLQPGRPRKEAEPDG